MKRDQITEEHLARYLEITQRALDKVVIAAPPRSFNRRLAESFLQMAQTYYKDALHFKEEGDLVNAFACVNYAHGWLDCGARIGIFDVGQDDQLFTLYE
ncbi:MAG: DUF357 domain-containing protein [Methanomassiliicoccales archaeon]|nr:MAG: DUF357 domain-containing protein [Methanomassiliicoccales archaeon]